MSFQLYWKQGIKNLVAFGGEFPVTNWVRNEVDHTYHRQLGNPHEVVKTEPDDGSTPMPYMPRWFPVGDWEITAIQEHSPAETYLYPYYIATNAWQMVDEWALDSGGGYKEKTGRKVRDAGYGIHFPGPSITTLGCLRITTEPDIRAIAAMVRNSIEARERVYIRVEA